MNTPIQDLLRISFSLLPVFFFLLGLILIDSYKLVKLQAVLISIIAGCGAALGSFLINSSMLDFLAIEFKTYSRYCAPIVEESLKAAFLIYLIRKNKMGFKVDTAIHGFAIGAGFAFLENIYYLRAMSDATLMTWIIRGFGTAIMHGGVTAIFGIIAKSFHDQQSSIKYFAILPAFVLAIGIHSLFNHFFLTPLQSTLLLLFVFPIIISLVYSQSEKSTHNWVGVGLDTDQELLELITSGNLSETKIGRYLHSLRDKFPGEIVVDMLCFLRIHLELSIRAKGILMMQESGFKPAPDTEIKAKFKELKYLEKSIGPIGHLAILPFMHTSNRNLWQLHMLGGNK